LKDSLEIYYKMNIDRYKEIKSLANEFKQTKIATHIPSPTSKDYTIGYIKRYFIQKANDVNSPISEIKQSAYSSFNGNPFYRVVSMDWRIVGEPVDVKASNSASIRINYKIIPKLQLYLPNLLQFHKK